MIDNLDGTFTAENITDLYSKLQEISATRNDPLDRAIDKLMLSLMNCIDQALSDNPSRSEYCKRMPKLMMCACSVSATVLGTVIANSHPKDRDRITQEALELFNVQLSEKLAVALAQSRAADPAS